MRETLRLDICGGKEDTFGKMEIYFRDSLRRIRLNLVRQFIIRNQLYIMGNFEMEYLMAVGGATIRLINLIMMGIMFKGKGMDLVKPMREGR